MDDFKLDVSGVRFEGKGVLVDSDINKYVGLKESPLFVHVESDTDWATVAPSAAGVVVALLVAWLTVGVQRNQIKANLSTFRHHWMTELREAASEQLQVMAYLANQVAGQKGYKGSDDYIKTCARGAQLRAKVELLLSRDDEFSTPLMAAGREALKTVSHCKYGDDISKLFSTVSDYKNLLRAELERAWIDAQDDLGINKRVMSLNPFKIIGQWSRSLWGKQL